MIKEAINFAELYAQWIGEGLYPVPAERSQARADVCLACPKHAKWPLYEVLAGSAALLVKRQIELKNKMKLRVRGEKSLHVCSACKCILRLKVHAPIEFIADTTDLEELHPNCWITREIHSGVGN